MIFARTTAMNFEISVEIESGTDFTKYRQKRPINFYHTLITLVFVNRENERLLFFQRDTTVS